MTVACLLLSTSPGCVFCFICLSAYDKWGKVDRKLWVFDAHKGRSEIKEDSFCSEELIYLNNSSRDHVKVPHSYTWRNIPKDYWVIALLTCNGNLEFCVKQYKKINQNQKKNPTREAVPQGSQFIISGNYEVRRSQVQILSRL